MLKKRLVSIILCFTLVMACLPVFSLSGSADNSGFLQLRIFYQFLNPGGTWSAETSAIITDNSYLNFGINGTTPIRITRILVRNDSGSTMYFQFDINFGGVIPDPSIGVNKPNPTYSTIAFTTNGGLTAYQANTTDRSPFVYTYASDTDGNPLTRSINSASSKTFFGKVTNSGYLTFTDPVVITWRKYDSPYDELYMFFRHVIIGLDDSSYLANLENALNNIDSNVNQIADWMEEEHELFDEQWQGGGGDAYEELASDNQSLWSTLRGLFGFSVFGGLFSLDIFSTSNSLFGRWFSQQNSDDINGSSKKSPGETEFVNYYEQNVNGELDVFGLGGD